MIKCYIYGGSIEYETRKIQFQTGIHPGFRRMCHRTWQPMEISVHVRLIRRSRIYFNLLIVLIDHGYSGYGLRIFHWTRKQEERSYGI